MGQFDCCLEAAWRGLNDLKDDYGVYGERYIRNDRGIMHRLEAFSDGVFTQLWASEERNRMEWHDDA